MIPGHGWLLLKHNDQCYMEFGLTVSKIKSILDKVMALRHIANRAASIFRKKRPESLLLKSLKDNYPKWVESGLVRPNTPSASPHPHAVLSGESSK